MTFDESFKISCFDENVISNALVGETIVKAQDLCGKK
jgi:hypothetical protein